MTESPAHTLALRAVSLEETCASACVRAMRCLFNQDWLLWEPETLWLELDREGVDVPVGNRAQIMAARNLYTTGRAFYDAHAFAATALAFNNEEPLHVGIEEAPVAFLNWAVFESESIYRELDSATGLPDYDREPSAYTAVQLFREGFVLAPEHLTFADDELVAYFKNNKEALALRETVKEGWAVAPKGEALRNAAFPETAAGVQLARLAAAQSYFEKRHAERIKQLAPLKC